MAGYTITTTNGELYHHGIKGQKWGVRRYQNPDGTLTSDGKKRYDTAKSDYKKAKKEYNKSFNKMYRQASNRPIYTNFTEKGKEEFKNKSDKMYDDLEKMNNAKKEYVVAKRLNKEAKRVEKKNASLQKDIDSFKGYENGIYTKDGKMVLSSDDVKKSVNALKELQNKNNKKLNDMIQKFGTTTITKDKETGEYILNKK